MVSEITEGIEVMVKAKFEEKHSNFSNGMFLFSYHISISNKSNQPIKLLKRHWKIQDSNGEFNEVIGDGVVGNQPVIEPNQTHSYESYCNLKTDLGAMKGTYLMQRLTDKAYFEVAIPEFQLEAPFKAN